MKRIAILFTLACLPLLGMSQELPRHKKPKETKDAEVLDITKNNGTTLEYKTPADIKVELEKKASLNMWDETRKAEELEKYPKGGYLIISINRLTIDAADTKFFTVVLTDPAGKEINRKQFKGRVASPTTLSGSMTVWNNLGIASFDEPIPTGTKAFVIDAINQQRHEYLIQN